MNNDQLQTDSFFSYCRDHAVLVKPIVQLLELHGRKVFVDTRNIKPGECWPESIINAIEGSKEFVLLWCCHAAGSGWVDKEINLALHCNTPIIPILLCDKPVPSIVANYQWIDFIGLFNHQCLYHPLAATASQVQSKIINQLAASDFEPLIRQEIGLKSFDKKGIDDAWNKLVKPQSSLMPIANKGSQIYLMWIIALFSAVLSSNFFNMSLNLTRLFQKSVNLLLIFSCLITLIFWLLFRRLVNTPTERKMHFLDFWSWTISLITYCSLIPLFVYLMVNVLAIGVSSLYHPIDVLYFIGSGEIDFLSAIDPIGTLFYIGLTILGLLAPLLKLNSLPILRVYQFIANKVSGLYFKIKKLDLTVVRLLALIVLCIVRRNDSRIQ